MLTHRRISIGHAVSDETDNEWHQKIRDILDVLPHKGSDENDISHVETKKKRPTRRRTVCCDGIDANESGLAKTALDKDESTASLSNSSNDISPTSLSRPDLSKLYSEKWRQMTPSPKKDGIRLPEPLLAKNRVNSPGYCGTGSTGTDVSSSCENEVAISSTPSPPFVDRNGEDVDCSSSISKNCSRRSESKALDDILPPKGSDERNNVHIESKKKRPTRRRTVCCDGMHVNLSNSSNDISPTSPPRPDVATLYSELWGEIWREMTPSPKKNGIRLPEPLLAKNRVNSPGYCGTGSTSDGVPPSPSPPFVDGKGEDFVGRSASIDKSCRREIQPKAGPIRHLQDHCKDKNHSIKSNMPRRSSKPSADHFNNDCSKPSTSLPHRPILRRSSCSGTPFETANKNYDDILPSPSPKTKIQRFFINVRRKSSYDEHLSSFNSSLPFFTSKAARRASDTSAHKHNFSLGGRDIDITNTVDINQASQSLLHRQRLNKAGDAIPFEITTEKLLHRSFNDDKCSKTSERRQRRRASDYDVPYSYDDSPNVERVIQRKTSHKIHPFQDAGLNLCSNEKVSQRISEPMEKLPRRSSNNVDKCCKTSERKQRRRASDYDVPYSYDDFPKDKRLMQPKTSHMIHPSRNADLKRCGDHNDSPPISVLICKKPNSCGNKEKKAKSKRERC